MEFSQQIIKIRDIWDRARQHDREEKKAICSGNQDHKVNSKMGDLDSHRIFSSRSFSFDSLHFFSSTSPHFFPIPIRFVFLMQIKSHLPNS